MLEAVLFDYGHTLLDFRFDEDVWLGGLRDMLAAAGGPPERAPELREELRRRLARLDADPDDHAELVYMEVVAEALAAVGTPAGPDLVRAAIEAEHRGWASARHLHPRALWLLDEVRARGLRIGIVSNTFDPPDLLHADVAADGVAERVDSVVFSSEVGVRKPGPAIYRAALDALGVEPRKALFVGDRVREDIQGPAALGMRTCLVTYFRVDEGDHGLADAVAASPTEVLEAVDRVVAADESSRL
jgi:HAD superfamily hydrolase (TIGR01509 family)